MFFQIIFCLFLLLPTSNLAAETQYSNWTLLRDDNGVKAYSQDLQNSNFVAFRGVVEVNSTIDEIIDVFIDDTNWDKWGEKFHSGHIVEHKTREHKIFYQAFKMPPFVDNRDMVYEYKVQFDRKTGKTFVSGKSIEHPEAPETIGVRMKLTFARWTLIPLTNNKTRIDLEVHSDPGGAIPAWLVNWSQRNYPHNLLSSLRKRLEWLKNRTAKID